MYNNAILKGNDDDAAENYDNDDDADVSGIKPTTMITMAMIVNDEDNVSDADNDNGDDDENDDHEK